MPLTQPATTKAEWLERAAAKCVAYEMRAEFSRQYAVDLFDQLIEFEDGDEGAVMRTGPEDAVFESLCAD